VTVCQYAYAYTSVHNTDGLQHQTPITTATRKKNGYWYHTKCKKNTVAHTKLTETMTASQSANLSIVKFRNKSTQQQQYHVILYCGNDGPLNRMFSTVKSSKCGLAEY